MPPTSAQMNVEALSPWLSCNLDCAEPVSMETLNRDCFCVAVQPDEMRAALAASLGAHGLPQSLAESHPHLFAALPVYVSREHIEQVERFVAALERVVATPAYRERALARAPEIARFDPGSPGGLLGLDFHLSPDGPRLIEVNTNPGGALLNTLMAQVHRVCMPQLVGPPTDVVAAEQGIVQAMRHEWQLQRGDRALRTVAICDDAPQSQYLYPEFVLFQALFARHGMDAVICDPKQLERRGGQLWFGGIAVDMVYNRLTDFDLAEAGHAVLREAYLAGEVVLTPHPHAHAVYADKRNLVLLGDRDFLREAGVDPGMADAVASAVPRTVELTVANRDALWSQRRGLFFKPAAGFGSKASYRGDKLTRGTWEAIAGGQYVAQALVPPSERRLGHDQAGLKVDIRCYAYRGHALLYAARLYQGQTTNFRTPGGGFAPVLTAAHTPV